VQRLGGYALWSIRAYQAGHRAMPAARRMHKSRLLTNKERTRNCQFDIHMKYSLKTWLIAATIIAGYRPVGAVAASAVLHPAKTIQSEHPSYVAKVADGQLISIKMQPQTLKLDMNSANSIQSETGDFKPARYTFPETAAPQSVLTRLTDIYKYDRRRDVPIVSSGGDWVIAEYFRGGSHIPTTRFQLLGKQVQHQELLDAAGRTTKVVVVGWARASAAYDDETSDLSALGDHPAWIRVFKVTPGGKKQLAAIAWRKAPFSHTPDTYDEPKSNDLEYGSTVGVVKWRNQTDFIRAENIDLEARGLNGVPHRRHAGT
jgi:hypothetical protein